MDIYKVKRNIFKAAEDALEFKVNDILKDVLIIHGFDSPFMLSKITDDDIMTFEVFIQRELSQYLTIEQRQEFFGIYFNQTENFKILAGLKKQIIFISQYYKHNFGTAETKSVGVQADELHFRGERSRERTSNASSASSANVSNSGSVDLNVDHISEGQHILNSLKKWLRTKVSENIWPRFQNHMDNVILEVKLPSERNPFLQQHCNITCFCGQKYKILKVARKENCKPRWIYSNIQKHFITKHVNVSYKRKIEETSSLNGKQEDKQDIRKFLVSKLQKYSHIPSSENERTAMASTSTQDSVPGLFNKKKANINILQNIRILQNEQALDVVMLSDEKLTSKKTGKEQNNKSTCKVLAKLDIDVNQPLITEFYPILEKINNVFQTRKECILNMSKNIIELTEDNNNFVGSPTEKACSLIEALYKKSVINSKKSKHANSHDDTIKKFALYLYYVGGKLLYEVLQTNLQNSLPAITTLNRYVINEKKHFDEGHFDFVGLKNFLIERKLPLFIWIGEDATRITGKIEYNSNNNKVMGFVLPLKNGIPQTETYKATTANNIEYFFSNCKKANYGHVVMAQPLSAASPALCLSIFGTDNCYDFKSVLSRWNYLKQEAGNHGITIMGFSSDGDTRYLKAMRTSANLSNNKEEKWPWFHVDLDAKEIESFVQDTVHIGTKLRNRLFKENSVLPIGSYNITIDHLRMLIEKYDKSQHFLTISDINSDDKMNFKSVLKIIDVKVQKLLGTFPECRGTCNYLKLVSYILSSYLEKALSVEKRLYNIWYAVFFLRIWRVWVKNNNMYKLRDNFVSDNAYLCVELNAHYLVKLVVIFRENNLQPDMFCPWLYGSQCCENIFRCTRSMTSTFATVVNFSIKDIIQRIGKIRALNDIQFDLKDTIVFPRNEKREKRILKETESELPATFAGYSDAAIEEIIEKALTDARDDLKILGISDNTQESWLNIGLETKQESTSKDDEEELNINVEEETGMTKLLDDMHVEEEKHLEDFEVEVNGEINLKDYSTKVKTITEDSPFLQIKVEEKEAVIRKSTFCWLLEQGNGRVSTDRIRRFYTTSKKQKLPKKSTRKVDLPLSSSEDETVDIICNDSTDTETFSADSDDEQIIDMESKVIDIKLEAYYAVYYDEEWYIGRAVSKECNTFHFKFLKRELDNFVWPSHPDYAKVETKFVIYGPIDLLGNGPFQLRRQDTVNINKKYKLLKSAGTTL